VHLTRRQKEILDFLKEYIEAQGFAPTIDEIAHRFGLRSLATAHKHLVNLQSKGAILREPNRSRALEVRPPPSPASSGGSVEARLLGRVAAGVPIEAVSTNETIHIPEEFVGSKEAYVLRVNGDSMIEEQIRDGDYVIVENRREAQEGEMVIALLDGANATLKKLFREKDGRVRLQPANPNVKPLFLEASAVTIQGVVIGIMRKY
jgi:repressor LexA